MNLVVCPHCKSHRIVTAKVPRDVVVVMPCPSCGELVVMFRKKVIALSRKILEEGTQDERKMHLAEIIAEFLEPGMLGIPRAFEESEFRGPRIRSKRSDDSADESGKWRDPITDKDVDEFVKHCLDRIDDADYFNEHFH